MQNDERKPIYRLKITRVLRISSRKVSHPSVYFDWDSKEDALAAKALLEAASAVWPNKSRGTTVEFLEHVPDIPLV